MVSISVFLLVGVGVAGTATAAPLDLLGLQVDLSQVVLDITAEPGPSNLLGNLLCAVAGLLDNTCVGGLGGVLNGIAALLNRILGALG